MELSYNFADLFCALETFKNMVHKLHQRADRDPVDRKRIKAAMALAKADIEELFDRVGKEG